MSHFHLYSIYNKHQSISILVNFMQNTKAIALLFGQNRLIFITFQSTINIKSISTLVICRQNTKAIALLCVHTGSFSSPFNLQSTSINFNFGHCATNYQGYTLTFWRKLAHFRHLSIYNQNQSISSVVILRQITKAIALLFGQNRLIFITFQSTININ